MHLPIFVLDCESARGLRKAKGDQADGDDDCLRRHPLWGTAADSQAA